MGHYLRIRVCFNVIKPLKRGSRVFVTRIGKVLAIFHYERLPDFCYVCEKLDHQEHDCNEAVCMKKVGNSKGNMVLSCKLRGLDS